MSECESHDALAEESALVCVVATVVEAQIAQAALRQAGIPCILDSFTTLNPFDGIWIPQRGWGRIIVRQRDVKSARQVIEEALATNPSRDEEGAQEEP